MAGRKKFGARLFGRFMAIVVVIYPAPLVYSLPGKVIKIQLYAWGVIAKTKQNKNLHKNNVDTHARHATWELRVVECARKYATILCGAILLALTHMQIV